MNKSGLIDAISNTTSLTKREAEDAVNALVHAVVTEVRVGRRVAVVGFGSFNPTQRGARMGRNPQTGAPVKIAASKGFRFSASSTLKGIVNGKAPLPALKASSTPANKSVQAFMPAARPPLKNAAKASITSSTRTAVRRAPARTIARRPPVKVVKRVPATPATKRALARNTAKRSANKAVRRAPATGPAKRAPARKAAKRSAKKAVRRA